MVGSQKVAKITLQLKHFKMIHKYSEKNLFETVLLQTFKKRWLKYTKWRHDQPESLATPFVNLW